MSHKIDQKAEDVNNTALALIKVEYLTLRDETIKRIELGHKIISLTLVVAGAFLSVGIQPGIPASVLLVYPLLAMFLAAGWAHNDLRIRQITAYIIKIEEETENMPVGLRWVHYLMSIRPRVGFSRILGVLSASGIFLITQLIVLLLALVRTTFPPIEGVLFIIDVIAIILTIIMLRGLEGWK